METMSDKSMTLCGTLKGWKWGYWVFDKKRPEPKEFPWQGPYRCHLVLWCTFLVPFFCIMKSLSNKQQFFSCHIPFKTKCSVIFIWSCPRNLNVLIEWMLNSFSCAWRQADWRHYLRLGKKPKKLNKDEKPSTNHTAIRHLCKMNLINSIITILSLYIFSWVFCNNPEPTICRLMHVCLEFWKWCYRTGAQTLISLNFKVFFRPCKRAKKEKGG